jgi:two-component system nitrogen regulation sensor histidine kinase GlnL
MDSEDLFQNIFSSMIDGMFLVAPDGKIIQTNLASEEMFRQSRDSLLCKSFQDLFPDDPGVEQKIWQTLNIGTSFRDIDCLGRRHNSESPFPVSLTVSPFIKDNATQGVLIHARDLSLLKELEETSRQMEHISNLGVLSLGMAHEIKNPLVAISGSAQILRNRLPEEHHQFLDVVIKESERINRMMERMLAFARPANLNVQSINIHQVLEDILLLEKKRADGSIEFLPNYDPSLPTVEGDEDQLKQVFLNLIRNAVEAVKGEGRISITTRYHSNYAVKPPQNPGVRQDIIVEITDTGTGIPHEELKNLFTPFHTTKSKGSGLGLPISLKIVENHGGKIKIISEPGEGTTVKVYLPLKQS